MTAALSGLFLFDPRKAPSASRHRRTDGAPGAERARRLYCIACRQLITHIDERISKNGAPEHTVRNPYGIEFHVGCFKSAYGCRAPGAPTRAHTWFPGYAWRLALCVRCGLHLGWLYQGDIDSFHGLILNRLTTGASGASA